MTIAIGFALTAEQRWKVKKKMDYEEFAHWIAKQIFFKEVKDDLFVELTCRKLAQQCKFGMAVRTLCDEVIVCRPDGMKEYDRFLYPNDKHAIC